MIANFLENAKQSYNFKGRRSEALFGSLDWHNFVKNIDRIFNFKIGFVPAGFENRPDLISNIFFDTPELWWLIMRANNIEDPFEELGLGARIRLPVNDL